MSYTPRKEIRVPINGTIAYSLGLVTQRGTVKDISMQGCLVEAERPPQLASLVSCCMVLPGLDASIEVQLALVQWVDGNTFGLKIVETSAETQKRLRRFLEDNYVQLARAKRGRSRPQSTSPVYSESVVRGTPSGPLPSASRVQGGLVVPDAKPNSATGCLEDPVAILPQDLSAFVGWILDARHAFEEKAPLPVPPSLQFEEFKACAQFIQTLLDQSETAQSRSAGAPSGVHSQHEVLAHLLTQLKSDDRALSRVLSMGGETCHKHENASENPEVLPSFEGRAERRARARRSTPRANTPGPMALSVRLARLIAMLKLPSWFARM